MTADHVKPGGTGDPKPQLTNRDRLLNSQAPIWIIGN
jgi:hypothetical protein